jgi:Family of unknown function (DUF6069)
VTSQANAAAREKIRERSPRRERAAIAAIGVAAAVVAWLALQYGAHAHMLVKLAPGRPATHVTLVSAIVASALAGLAGWGVLTLLERRTAHPHRNWLITSIAVLVVSLAGPLAAGQGTGAKLSLAVLHLAVAAAIIPRLAWSASDAPPGSGRRGWRSRSAGPRG